jgi:hypothetical protein
MMAQLDKTQFGPWALIADTSSGIGIDTAGRALLAAIHRAGAMVYRKGHRNDRAYRGNYWRPAFASQRRKAAKEKQIRLKNKVPKTGEQ